MTPEALLNGRPESGSWTLSRGLHYGDGVFRTCLIHDSRVHDLERQLAKLAEDAAALELSPQAVRACGGEAQTLAAGHRLGVLKIVLWRGAAQRGYRPQTTAAERLLIRDALPPLPARCWTEGVAAVRSPVVLSQQPRLAGIKHLNRLEQVLASADWPRGVAEAILADGEGRPIGGTRTNLFWAEQGRLYTPELSACGVAGMTRKKILELAQRLGIPWRIGRWSWREFERADEAFLTNSLIGIWPLRALDAQAWPGPGAITRRLMAELAHPELTGR